MEGHLQKFPFRSGLYNPTDSFLSETLFINPGHHTPYSMQHNTSSPVMKTMLKLKGLNFDTVLLEFNHE
jgi:hypothetical protein